MGSGRPSKRGICFELPPYLCRQGRKLESCTYHIFPGSVSPDSPSPSPPCSHSDTHSRARSTRYVPAESAAARPAGALALALAQRSAARSCDSGSRSLQPLRSRGCSRVWATGLGRSQAVAATRGRRERPPRPAPRLLARLPRRCPALRANSATAALPGARATVALFCWQPGASSFFYLRVNHQLIIGDRHTTRVLTARHSQLPWAMVRFC